MRSVTNSAAAIARLDRPSATRASTSRSRSVSSASGSSRRRRPNSRATIVGSITRLALGDPAQRVDEHRDVEDALLEQVADALGVLLEQPQRVARLDVLGEHQHADVGVLGADPLRRDQALVGVGRRHPDVDDRGVRAARAGPAAAALGVAAWPTTSTPASVSRRAMPSRVSMTSSAIDYAHGISARRSSSAPTSSAAAERADAVGESREPPVRAAPSSATSTTSRRRVATRDRRRASRRARRVPIASATTMYAAVSTAGGSAPAALAELDRQRRVVGERRERSAEPGLGRASRGGCRARARATRRARPLLAAGRGEQRRQLGVARRPRAARAGVERRGEQPLLRAVVEVALEPPPLGVAGLDDARARSPQVLRAGPAPPPAAARSRSRAGPRRRARARARRSRRRARRARRGDRRATSAVTARPGAGAGSGTGAPWPST